MPLQVLVFSQMTTLMDILGDYLYIRGIKFSRLDGSMHFQDRVEQVNQYSVDKVLKLANFSIIYIYVYIYMYLYVCKTTKNKGRGRNRNKFHKKPIALLYLNSPSVTLW